MATTPASLGDGLLTDVTSTILTVGASAKWVGVKVHFSNIHATLNSIVYVYVHQSGGSNRLVARLVLDYDGGNAVVSIPALSSSDLIKANANRTNSVVWTAYGGTQ